MGPHTLMCTLLTTLILTVSCDPPSDSISTSPRTTTSQEINPSMSIIGIGPDTEPSDQNQLQRAQNDNWYTKPEIVISAAAGVGVLLLISIVLCIISCCCFYRRGHRRVHQEWNPMELDPLSPENHEFPSLTPAKMDTCTELTSETGITEKICTPKTDVENCTSNVDLENCTSKSENTVEEMDVPDAPAPCYPPPEPIAM